MCSIIQSAAQTIGGTPLLYPTALCKKHALHAKLLLKLEFLNPTGSVKDRAALYMVQDAEEKGLLKPGGTIIEPTSGNTGIGLAAIGAARGYRVILTMPETMSIERVNLLKAYGAEVIRTPGAKGMAGAVEKARELLTLIPGSFLPDQFSNPANARAHFMTTGPEIWQACGGQLDWLVAGVGTGGTITGTGRYLKEQSADLKVLAVEPEASQVLAGKPAGPHPLQGLGANFVPSLLDTSVYDEICPVSGTDAVYWAKELGCTEGILTGISSGAALAAAVQLARRPENENKSIAVILPDSADRYYSTDLFQSAERT